jgi:hypothetical protein
VSDGEKCIDWGKTHEYKDQDDVYVPAPLLPFPISQLAHVDHGRSFPPTEESTTMSRERVRSEYAPVALKLGADDACAGAPEVVADDPVALVLEHAFVERLDVASVGS